MLSFLAVRHLVLIAVLLSGAAPEQRMNLGASLLLRVASGEDGRPLAGVRVEVIPEGEGDKAVYATFAGGTASVPPVAHLVTDAQGWAKFSALPPGTFLLRAVPPQGLATFSEPFSVLAGEETLLDDLVLPQPASAEVRIEGALSRLPAQAALTVEATGDETCGWRANARIAVPVDEGRIARFQELHPGPWVFRLLLDDGQGRRYELSRRTEEVPPGGMAAFSLAAGNLLFQGELTDRAEPVRAELRIRSRKEEENFGVIAHTASQDDGSFGVFLKEAGTYDVEVLFPDGGRSRISRVSFMDAERPVRLKVPDAGLGGVVVDAEEAPVADAEVYARRLSNEFGRAAELQVRSGPDGTFQLDRMEPGEWALEARQGKGRSEVRKIQLSASEFHDRVSLVVTEGLRIEGFLVAGGQPVAGVDGWVWCLWRSPQDPCGGALRTGAQGDFSLDLGPASPGVTVNLFFQAPGLPLAAYRVPVAGKPITLPLPPLGGRVRIVGEKEILAFESSRLMLVNEQGAILPLDTGRLGEAGGGSNQAERVLPSLAPGSWRLVAISSLAEGAQLFASGGVGLPALAAFQVQAGETVEVTLPLPDRARK
jgi:hypothetical protein